MQLTRTYPQTAGELGAIIREVSQEAEAVIVQAGHFLLYFDEKTREVYPCIADEQGSQEDSEGALHNHGHFPLLSWKLGLGLLQQAQPLNKAALVLVNDWQYMPKPASRLDFYARHKELPLSYTSVLSQMPEPIKVLQPERDHVESGTAPFFGEMNLRNRYKKRLARMIKAGALPHDASTELNGEQVSCFLPIDGGSPTEIYCSAKSADCTAEVAELVTQLAERHPNLTFVNIYPSVCREFVAKGTMLAQRLFNARVASVVNVGVLSSQVFTENDLMQGAEVSVNRF